MCAALTQFAARWREECPLMALSARTKLPMSVQFDAMGAPIAVSGGMTSGRSSVTHQYSNADS